MPTFVLMSIVVEFARRINITTFESPSSILFGRNQSCVLVCRHCWNRSFLLWIDLQLVVRSRTKLAGLTTTLGLIYPDESTRIFRRRSFFVCFYSRLCRLSWQLAVVRPTTSAIERGSHHWGLANFCGQVQWFRGTTTPRWRIPSCLHKERILDLGWDETSSADLISHHEFLERVRWMNQSFPVDVFSVPCWKQQFAATATSTSRNEKLNQAKTIFSNFTKKFARYRIPRFQDPQWCRPCVPLRNRPWTWLDNAPPFLLQTTNASSFSESNVKEMSWRHLQSQLPWQPQSVPMRSRCGQHQGL